MASTVRFRYPANGSRPPIDLFWYDGGMRPAIPEELSGENKELPQEGMMFVGDKGKILAGFKIQNPQIISGKKMEAPANSKAETNNQVQQTSTSIAQVCRSSKNRQTISRQFYGG